MIRAVFLAALLALAPAAEAAAPCDRACLTSLADRYMAALLRHDPKGLPWADRVAYAENSVKLPVREGTWLTIDAKGAAPLVIADPAAGRVVWIGTIADHGQQAYYAMDLRVADAKIVAAHAVIRRKEVGQPFSDPAAFARDRGFDVPLAKGAQTPRATLSGVAQKFLLQPGAAAPTSENGVALAAAPAFPGQTTRVRIFAIDEARGLVAAIGYRDIDAKQLPPPTTGADGKPVSAPVYPRSIAFLTALRIERGKVVRAETVSNELPFMMPFPWKD